VTYVPAVVGDHEIYIGFGLVEFKKLNIRVDPPGPDVPPPEEFTAIGPGVVGSDKAGPVIIKITCKDFNRVMADKIKNHVTCKVVSPDMKEIPSTLHAEDDGFRVTYSAQLGEQLIDIKIKDVHIQGSPFKPFFGKVIKMRYEAPESAKGFELPNFISIVKRELRNDGVMAIDGKDVCDITVLVLVKQSRLEGSEIRKALEKIQGLSTNKALLLLEFKLNADDKASAKPAYEDHAQEVLLVTHNQKGMHDSAYNASQISQLVGFAKSRAKSRL